MRFTAPIPFAGFALDRAAHRRKDALWLADARAKDAARLVLFQRGEILVEAERGASAALLPLWLLPSSLPALIGPAAEDLFLGIDADGAAYFAADAPPSFRLQDSPLAGMGEFVDVRAAAAQMPLDQASLIGAARAVLNWTQTHGFCARCGAPTVSSQAGWRRDCEACQAQHFPRLDPVVIMLPVEGDSCCLGRQGRFPPGMFSAFAGFVEPGETLEEACARELMEEVGLKVRTSALLGGQPWPFPHSLMLGLIAEVESRDLVLDQDEIDEALWLTKDEARRALAGGLERGGRKIWAPPPIAIAHHLLQVWAVS